MIGRIEMVDEHVGSRRGKGGYPGTTHFYQLFLCVSKIVFRKKVLTFLPLDFEKAFRACRLSLAMRILERQFVQALCHPRLPNPQSSIVAALALWRLREEYAPRTCTGLSLAIKSLMQAPFD